MASSSATKSKSVDYSHFVSLPLPLHPEMVTKLNNFQNSVLGNNKDLGIEKSLFINPKTFHLTVQMLKLENTDQIEAAAKVLQSVSPKIVDALERRPVYIRLQGLACMKNRGTPAKAYVVHAPLEVIGGKDRLIRACRMIIKAFIKAGLVLEEDANHELQGLEVPPELSSMVQKHGIQVEKGGQAGSLFIEFRNSSHWPSGISWL